MNIPAKVRGYLYVGLAVLAALVAVTIVFLDWTTATEVKEWAGVAVSLYAVFVGTLAKLNVTPDA